MTTVYLIKTQDYLKVGHTKDIEKRLLAYKNPKVIFTRRFRKDFVAMHFEYFCVKIFKSVGSIHILGEFFLYEKRVVKSFENLISQWRYFSLGRFPDLKFDSAFEVVEK